jgi:uncharacterized protein with NRDE domain
MCLIAFQIFEKEGIKGVFLCANRDEFFTRPTRELHIWEEGPGLLAGRDLQAGGTWLGVNQQGKIAFLTNFRDLKNLRKDAKSRGELVSKFLLEDIDAELYLKDLQRRKSDYNGYNLVLGNKTGFYYYSNVEDQIRKLGTGLYGLSNGILNEPWPKVKKVKSAFEDIRKNGSDPEALFRMMKDPEPFADRGLPDTGVGIDLERSLSPLFIRRIIREEEYGSRVTSILEFSPKGGTRFWERSYDLPGNVIKTKYYYSEGSSKDLSTSILPS